MTHPNLLPDQSMSEPSPWLDIAAELEKIAADARALVGEPAPAYFQIDIQPKPHNTPEAACAVDAIAEVLLGRPGETTRMSGGTYHHKLAGDRGPVTVNVYRRVPEPRLAGAAEELERLRAENEQLRAAERHPSWPTEPELKPWESLAPYADRVAGSMTPIDPDSSMEAHYDAEAATEWFDQKQVQSGGDPGRGAPFDEPATASAPEPVTWHFSFGHGQTDPDTGENLLDKYVTVVAPSVALCRAAMFSSRYGERWAFDYDPDGEQWREWGPRWTEHERIDAMPKAGL